MTPTLSDTSVLTDVELFGRTLPLAPSVATMKRPCTACNLQYIRAVGAAHHCCEHCAAEPEAQRAVVEKELARIDKKGEHLTERWLAYQADFDDATAERWTSLVQARQLAEAKLERAKVGSCPARMTLDEITEAIRTAEQDAARIATKIARTRTEVGNPLADILKNEDVYLHKIGILVRDKNRATLALQHLSIAAGDEPPY